MSTRRERRHRELTWSKLAHEATVATGTVPAGDGPLRAYTRAVAEVETALDGGVLTITLNRPDVLNAFNAPMHEALAVALDAAKADEVRAVVLTGAGRGFCVGQDSTEFREASGTS